MKNELGALNAKGLTQFELGDWTKDKRKVVLT